MSRSEPLHLQNMVFQLCRKLYGAAAQEDRQVRPMLAQVNVGEQAVSIPTAITHHARQSGAGKIRPYEPLQPDIQDQQQPGSSLLLTSVRPGEGKTFISRVVAHNASQLIGKKVLLVDGNFINPRLHLEYDCPNDVGFSDCLLSQQWNSASFHAQDDSGLTVLPAGRNCNPNLFFRKRLFADFLQHAAGVFGLVIIDGPTLKDGGNVLSGWVNGTALVVESEKTRREVIQGTIDGLHIDKNRYVGAILNKHVHYIPKFFYRNL